MNPWRHQATEKSGMNGRKCWLAGAALGVVAVFVAMADAKPPKKQRKADANKAAEEQVAKAPAAPIAPRVDQPKPERLTVDQVAKAAQQIDDLIGKKLAEAGQKPNPPASDEQFVRRVYLDLAGRVPTYQETIDFILDGDSAKRSKLVDRLLDSDGYRSTMYNFVADMLRAKDEIAKRIPGILYEEWIKDQLAANNTWDDVVHELLTAQGRATDNGPSGYMLRDRGMPLDNLSNTLTLFLGANVACAQCHDHPLAEWTQRDFYQMAAFFGATVVGNPKGQKDVRKNLKKLYKESDVPKQVVLGVLEPNLSVVRDENKNTLQFPKDYQYADAKPGDPVSPALIHWSGDMKNNPAYDGIDVSSPAHLREQFAKWLTHPSNPRFATAIANRLWKRLFGLAVHEPIADLDDLSAGSNPELLAQLTKDMQKVGFDLREFQRIACNTQAYQNQASAAPEAGKQYLFAGPVVRRMTAEQAWDSVLALVVGPQLDDYKLRRGDHVRELAIPEDQLKPDKIEAALKERADDLASVRNGMKDSGSNKKKNRNAKVNLEDYEGGTPPLFEGMTMARASELPQPAKEYHFLRMFGQSDRTIADGGSLEGAVPQVLMLMNGDVQQVIGSEKSLVRIDSAKQKSPQKQVEALYYSFLSRQPTREETSAVLAALQDGMTISDLTWVLFNSREFIFIQ